MVTFTAAREPTASALVAQRILAALDPLTSRMVSTYRAEVPEYAALADEVVEAEVRPVSRKVVEAFFSAVANGLPPDASTLPELAAMARRRLEMGVPLEPVLHVYRIAGRTVWDAVVAATAPGEERVLAELGAQWMDYIDCASSTVAAAYLEASHERMRHLEAQRSALLQALLAATDASDVAAIETEFSTTLADAYAPVLVAGDHAAARSERLAGISHAGSLYATQGDHVLLLAPGDVHLDLVSLLAVAGDGGIVVTGRAGAPGQGLRGELRHAETGLAAARATNRTGAFGPDDLIAERLVLAQPAVAELLREHVVAALARHDRSGLVVSTLRTFLDCGSIPETARRELVHPNTVVYRLRRVAAWTGLDVRIPNQAAVVVLALASPEGARL